MADQPSKWASSDAESTDLGQTSLQGAEPLPQEKVIFFIRHAESHWNLWTRTWRPSSLCQTLDAPLTRHGYEQAYSLQQALRLASTGAEESSTDGKMLRRLLEADAAWVSPLTRALQTALVVLLPMYEPQTALSSERRRLTFTLKPVAREVKSFGWDTIGTAVGNECKARACHELAPLVSAHELSGLRSAEVNATEVQRRWWTRTFENRAQARHRARVLLSDIAQSDHSTVIVVSHSKFLRELLREVRLVANASQKSKSALANDRNQIAGGGHAALTARKIANCGIVGCTLAQPSRSPAKFELSDLCSWTLASDGVAPVAAQHTRTTTRTSAKVAPEQ